MFRRQRSLPGALLLLLAGLPCAAAAQGPGSTAAQTLSLTAGTRAAAFAGAYTAMTSDPDGIFYNPAAVAWSYRALGAGYEEYVEGVTLGYLAGGFEAGPVGIGAGVIYLDAGRIDEFVPDPRHGGERGRPTGRTVGATEAAGRLALAAPFLDRRASMGVALGVATSDLAGVRHDALFVDLGAQYRAGDVTLGAALRNLGGGVGHEAYDGTPLPLEARLGVTAQRGLARRIGTVISTDLVVGVTEETTALAVGGEVGLLPDDGGLSAVLRAGTTLDHGEHLGRLRMGGGIGIDSLWFDYTVQTFDYLGMIHRVGLRWTR